MKNTFPLISLLIVTSILLGACGPSANESVIATAVALTVQAQATSTLEVPPSATPTVPGTIPSKAPTITPTKSIPVGSFSNCMVASLVSETIPDGTIYTPGQTFFKTWRIQNNSDCTWNTSYRLVFWDGEQMGSASYYNFPQYLPPGESADVSIQLAAPETAGTFKGEWKLQTPDLQYFGVGQYDSVIWTEIVVSTDKKPEYGITSVEYNLDRVPLNGCATNTRYTFTAHVAFSGPIKDLKLQFRHSDGFRATPYKPIVKAAGFMDFTDTWTFGYTNTQGPKWIMLVQIYPTYVEYDKLKFSFACP